MVDPDYAKRICWYNEHLSDKANCNFPEDIHYDILGEDNNDDSRTDFDLSYKSPLVSTRVTSKG